MTKGVSVGNNGNPEDKNPQAPGAPQEQPVPATPAAEQDNQPEAAEENKPGRVKNFLGRIFNRVSLSSAAAGAVVGMSVKIGAVAAFGSPLLAVGIGAVAIGLTGAAVRRGFDIHNHNKAVAENGGEKARYVADFFNAEKTGKNGDDYKKQLVLGIVFAGIGGFIGMNIADWFAGAPDVPPAPVPGDDLNAIVDVPPVDDGTVLVDPDVAPGPEGQGPDPVVENPAPAVEDPAPAVGQPEAVVEEPAPVVEQPEVDIEDPAPIVEQPDAVVEDPVPVVEQPDAVVEDPVPVVEQPDTAIEQPAPVVMPSLEERLGATMEDVRSLLPENPGRQLADVLNRIDSTNEKVSAQALKDLGYFFANGLRGVAENDVVANRLYELSLEVSGGQNLQAAHDLGYHLLYGKGTETDLQRAFELLTQAHEGGNRLSGPMLDYMNKHGLAPKP